MVIEKRVEKEIIKEKLTTIRHYISGRERKKKMHLFQNRVKEMVASLLEKMKSEGQEKQV